MKLIVKRASFWSQVILLEMQGIFLKPFLKTIIFFYRDNSIPVKLRKVVYKHDVSRSFGLYKTIYNKWLNSFFTESHWADRRDLILHKVNIRHEY